ncbi:MAG: ester cyclase [Chloroflexi bacterium]|nr:ester cyclase [Chloroflexota bacterium]MDA1002557.1 ester cyclase [Chloroflexota bacterium]
MTAQNEAIARRFLEETQNERNLDVVDEVVASGFVGRTAGITGIGALKDSILENLQSFPDLRVTIDEQLSDGDTVVSRYTARATQGGPFHGLEPTGKPVVFTAIAIHHFADGKITEGWRLVDRLDILEQIGRVGVNI